MSRLVLISFLLYSYLANGAVIGPCSIMETLGEVNPVQQSLQKAKWIFERHEGRHKLSTQTIRQKLEGTSLAESTIVLPGGPEGMRLLTDNEKALTFRHYFSDQVSLAKALNQNQLIAGPVPFVESGFTTKRYNDLQGVFLTLPEVLPNEIGLEKSSTDYIDIVIPQDFPVIKLSEKIFLVPGNPAPREWIKALQLREVENPRSLNTWEKRALEEIDQNENTSALRLEFLAQAVQFNKKRFELGLSSEIKTTSINLAQDLLNKKGKPAAQNNLAGMKDIVKYEDMGVPVQIKIVPPEQVSQMVFRHFSPQAESIRALGFIKSGPMHYVEVMSERHIVKFPNVTGVFMTTRDFSAKSVGVFDGPSVDFKIDSSWPVLQLEPGIFLVPLPTGRSISDKIQTYSDAYLPIKPL